MAQEKSIEVRPATTSVQTRSYSDLVLAGIIVIIISLMILPLPLWVVDTLVAINILIGVGLVLLAIYIPTATAFSSFPSVIMISTLFRLSLSIAITRLILLNADAGEIIETFGKIVVGGNMVVGIVVFIIITVVQFIVIAKGAERVAEVSARFTLDAMPGKQLSIDSDLRSGLLDKDDARERRRLLELESQLHGSLDGAMKFVKGDAIAGIVILIVNILGGLTIGVLQRDMDLALAAQTYSILTVGDGLVAQIPALLTSISAGLIITRTASEDKESHLGTSISRQIVAYPRVISMGGMLALMLMLVPGFPWYIFLVMGVALLAFSMWKDDFRQVRGLLKLPPSRVMLSAAEACKPEELVPPPVMTLRLGVAIARRTSPEQFLFAVYAAVNSLRDEYGVPIPLPRILVDETLADNAYRFEAHGIRMATGEMPEGYVFLPADTVAELQGTSEQHAFFQPPLPGYWTSMQSIGGHETAWNELQIVVHQLRQAILNNLGVFMGIQETSNLVNRWSQDYPDLIKEVLRVIAPQRLTEILRKLLQEGLPIRNLRDLFEAMADAGAREKDITLLVEMIRISLKHQISDRYADNHRKIRAILIHPELEDIIHQSIRSTSHSSQTGLNPEKYKKLMQAVEASLDEVSGKKGVVLLCSTSVRVHVRRLLEETFRDLPVLAFQELAGDIQIEPVGHVQIS